MINTANEGAPSIPTAMQSSRTVSGGEMSNITNSSNGRFPPIENALSELFNKERLKEAKRGV